MVDKILKQEEGITYQIFGPDEEEQAPPEEEGTGEEGEDGEKKPKEKKEKLPKHIYIEEVVREPKIHFYQVPKLGSYLAIKLEYDSCLFLDAFDAAVEDFKQVD